MVCKKYERILKGVGDESLLIWEPHHQESSDNQRIGQNRTKIMENGVQPRGHPMYIEYLGY